MWARRAAILDSPLLHTSSAEHFGVARADLIHPPQKYIRRAARGRRHILPGAVPTALVPPPPNRPMPRAGWILEIPNVAYLNDVYVELGQFDGLRGFRLM